MADMCKWNRDTFQETTMAMESSQYSWWTKSCSIAEVKKKPVKELRKPSQAPNQHGSPENHTSLERKNIWTKPPWFWFHLSFPGCNSIKGHLKKPWLVASASLLIEWLGLEKSCKPVKFPWYSRVVKQMHILSITIHVYPFLVISKSNDAVSGGVTSGFLKHHQ